MTTLRPAHAGLLSVLALLPFSAPAQDGALPAEAMKAIFSKENRARLCNADNRVRSTVLLGELGKAYQLNLFALPDTPEHHDANGKPIPPPAGTNPNFSYAEPVAQRAAYWIATSSQLLPDEAARFGLKAEHKQLTALNRELVGFAHKLTPEKGLYRLLANVDLGDDRNRADRARVVSLMVNPPADPGVEPTAAITCSTDPADNPADPKKPPASEGRALIVAVRGNIDDLAILRSDEAFKKTTDAKIAYTMNGAKNEESVAANVAVGIGWAIAQDDALLGFARYTETSTETKVQGDDDDSKDVRAISAGVMYAHPFESGPLNVQTGITAYKTWDRAQDSRLLRIRAFADDITLMFARGPIVCGRESNWGPLNYSCRTGIFAEMGRVLAPGRSADFADTRDDDYAGLGADIALSFWLTNLKPLSNLMLTTQYRKMWILDGDLDNPDRFVIELSYKFPDSDVSLGLSRTYGENFDTFQKEELNLLSIGFKY